MKLRLRLRSHAWMLVPLCACAFVLWGDWIRIRHAERITSLTGEPEIDATSSTGYRGGVRWLVIPGHNNESFGWITQTQQMFAEGDWRVRHVAHENAPIGRDVRAASPYRWWLGLIAWLDHQVSGRPIGQAVEYAALLADPILHVLLLVGTTIFVALRFGVLPAAVLSVGMATLYPFASGFSPGFPDDQTLTEFFAVWSLLLLIAGASTGTHPGPSSNASQARLDAARAKNKARRWFILAGIAGGLGLWTGVGIQVPILCGIAIGAVVAEWLAGKARSGAASDAMPWRAWALSGATTSLCGYVIEYAPAHLATWELRTLHPLFSLAWLGIGELLVLTAAWFRQGKRTWNPTSVGLAVAGVAALGATPVTMWLSDNRAFLAADHFSANLTRLPDAPFAANLRDWLHQDGLTQTLAATLAPVFLVVAAIALLCDRSAEPTRRTAIALSIGPVLVAIGMAATRLSWWNMFGGMLLVLLVAAAWAMRRSNSRRATIWLWIGGTAGTVVLGVRESLLSSDEASSALTRSEALGLIERDLAHRLATQTGAGRAVILAPPNETASLSFYGGLRGLTTLDWGNPGGLVAAIRITSATTEEEALELILQREITHIIFPSWDSALDEYARRGLGQINGSFLDRLHHWTLPPWLRPISYQLPAMQGLEGQSVVVLEVVEEQNDAVRYSRAAEYFVEMGWLDLAATTGQTLRRFPADLGALVARAQVYFARGESDNLTEALDTLVTRLSRRADRFMPWDRRVSMAIVLARGKKVDLAREQASRCATEVNEAKLRSLSTASLYHFQVLCDAFELTIEDPELRQLVRTLLPAELRNRLHAPAGNRE